MGRWLRAAAGAARRAGRCRRCRSRAVDVLEQGRCEPSGLVEGVLGVDRVPVDDRLAGHRSRSPTGCGRPETLPAGVAPDHRQGAPLGPIAYGRISATRASSLWSEPEHRRCRNEAQGAVSAGGPSRVLPVVCRQAACVMRSRDLRDDSLELFAPEAQRRRPHGPARADRKLHRGRRLVVWRLEHGNDVVPADSPTPPRRSRRKPGARAGKQLARRPG
jgi:hypothetical protein